MAAKIYASLQHESYFFLLFFLNPPSVGHSAIQVAAPVIGKQTKRNLERSTVVMFD